MTENLVTHDAQCIQDRAAYEAFVARWPGFCTACGGWGYTYVGGTYNHPPESDPCSCVEEGQCPRCGKEADLLTQPDGDFTVCPHCGWDERMVVYQTEGWRDMVCPEWECTCGWFEEDYDGDPFEGIGQAPTGLGG